MEDWLAAARSARTFVGLNTVRKRLLPPEYIDAVDAVRWGWTLWIAYLFPAGIVRGAILAHPFPAVKNRFAVGSGAFALACCLLWFLVIMHGNGIQSTKELNMTMDAEVNDWASDTWHSFAPFTVIPASVIYCSVNLAVAALVRSIWNLVVRFLGRDVRAVTVPPVNRLRDPGTGNPCRPPAVPERHNSDE